MLPNKSKPKMRDVGLYLPVATLAKADAIVKAERVKSRNALLTSLLEFSVELFSLLRPFNAEAEAFKVAEGCEYAEAVARLVERGLRAKK